MSDAPPLRRWSALSEAERAALLAEYRALPDCEDGTCRLDEKIARMNRFLAPRGVILTEDDLRAR